MGCAGSREHLGNEEKAIMKGEESLGWKKFTSTEAITAFEHRGSKDSLSSQQFKAALGDFGADFAWLDSPDSEQYKTFSNFREGRNFDALKLQLLAILIGKGSAKDKANFLFDAFDADANQELTKTEVTAAFEGLADIAINSLVDLGVGKIEEGKLDEATIQIYKKKLEEKRDEKVTKIVSDIFGDQEKVCRGAFQSKMVTKNFAQLVTSSGLRVHIHKAGPPTEGQNENAQQDDQVTPEEQKDDQVPPEAKKFDTENMETYFDFTDDDRTVAYKHEQFYEKYWSSVYCIGKSSETEKINVKFIMNMDNILFGICNENFKGGKPAETSDAWAWSCTDGKGTHENKDADYQAHDLGNIENVEVIMDYDGSSKKLDITANGKTWSWTDEDFPTEAKFMWSLLSTQQRVTLLPN